jgi:large conductance mechanosensitive channel
MFKEFRAFIMRGNVVDLATAVIVGGAFGAIVKSLVDDVIMPPIGLALGRVDFTNLFVVLKAGTHPPPYPSLADAKASGAVTMNFGVFVNTIVAFLIIGAVVFAVVRLTQRLYHTPAPPTPDTKPCDFCTLSIPRLARRCPHCTSQLAAG